MSEADGFCDMEDYARARQEWLIKHIWAYIFGLCEDSFPTLYLILMPRAGCTCCRALSRASCSCRCRSSS